MSSAGTDRVAALRTARTGAAGGAFASGRAGRGAGDRSGLRTTSGAGLAVAGLAARASGAEPPVGNDSESIRQTIPYRRRRRKRLAIEPSKGQAGLMFEQQIEPLPRRGGGATHLEQQVGDRAAQLLVDERACGAAQRGPEDAALVGVRAGARGGRRRSPRGRRTPSGTGDRGGDSGRYGRCHHALTMPRRQRRFSAAPDRVQMIGTAIRLSASNAA